MLAKDQLRGRHVIIKGARELLLSDVPEAARARFPARLRQLDSGCVVFTGALNGDGYGVVKVSYKPTRIVLAHRLAYAIAYGSCPPHLVIDHMCQERRCCNVKHFRLTTPESNTPAIFGAPQSVRPQEERPLRAIEGGRIVTYPSVAACFAEIERRAVELHGPRCAHGYFFCTTCRRPAPRPTARAVPNTWSDEPGGAAVAERTVTV